LELTILFSVESLNNKTSVSLKFWLNDFIVDKLLNISLKLGNNFCIASNHADKIGRNKGELSLKK
jgi:hypothetical protein